MSALPTVKIDSFEGPFDLLLELARESKVDLLEVSLGKLSGDYNRYMTSVEVPAEIRADFVMVAATLILMKLKLLLPSLTEDEEEEIHELSERLAEYKHYRSKALWIKEMWGKKMLLPGPEKLSVLQGVVYPSTSVSDLEKFMRSTIEGIKTVPQKNAHLRSRGKSLRDCVNLLRARIKRVPKAVFQEIVKDHDRQTRATSLLALLEMARKNEVRVFQSSTFGDLIIQSSEKP